MKQEIAGSVDAYLASIDWPEARAALERLRAIIRDELPDAQECISYGMPGYKRGGHIGGFAAFKSHCSFFPGGIAERYADRLPGFKIAKGTIQFTPEKPIPEALVREIVRARANKFEFKKKR
jgi:uncharacterized protein YdhG (YjbR/CyaY superfamily)